MIQLSPAQWSQLDRLVFEIRSLPDLTALRDFVLERLPNLLGGHFSSWNGHNEEMFLTEVANSRSHEEQVSQLLPVLNASLPTHPVFAHFMDLSSGKVRYVDTVERTRGHTSDENYHQSEFYRAVASPLEIEDQLLLHVFVTGGSGILITLHFQDVVTPEVHLLASILRGHLVVRYHDFLAAPLPGQNENEIARLKSHLSKREYEVLGALCEGPSNGEIALQLGVSTRTIDKHVENIFRKLEIGSRNVLIARYAPLFRS